MNIKLHNSVRQFLTEHKTVARVFTTYSTYWRFRTEKDLLSNKRTSRSTHPSILHFSLNKAATQYTKAILKRCAKANSLVHAGMNEYAFHSNLPFLDGLTAEEMRDFVHVFHKTGYLYSAFGGMIEGIPNLTDYKVVLMVRDPRDILVSGYFSKVKTHMEPSVRSNKYETFMRERREAERLSIDKYVLATSGRLTHQMNRYDLLFAEAGVQPFITRYEDMTADFENWLAGLLGACELKVSDRLFRKIVADNAGLTPREEDASRHVRKGRPGDYSDKLQKSTIRRLNRLFAPALERYGYSTS